MLCLFMPLPKGKPEPGPPQGSTKPEMAWLLLNLFSTAEAVPGLPRAAGAAELVLLLLQPSPQQVLMVLEVLLLLQP